MEKNIEQLKQLTIVTWDGNLISKAARDELVKCGYACSHGGFNYLTTNGIIVLINLGCLKTK